MSNSQAISNIKSQIYAFFSFKGKIGRLKFSISILITAIVIFSLVPILYDWKREIHSVLENGIDSKYTALVVCFLIGWVILFCLSSFYATNLCVRRLTDLGLSAKLAMIVPIDLTLLWLILFSKNMGILPFKSFKLVICWTIVSFLTGILILFLSIFKGIEE